MPYWRHALTVPACSLSPSSARQPSPAGRRVPAGRWCQCRGTPIRSCARSATPVATITLSERPRSVTFRFLPFEDAFRMSVTSNPDPRLVRCERSPSAIRDGRRTSWPAESANATRSSPDPAGLPPTMDHTKLATHYLPMTASWVSARIKCAGTVNLRAKALPTLHHECTGPRPLQSTASLRAFLHVQPPLSVQAQRMAAPRRRQTLSVPRHLGSSLAFSIAAYGAPTVRSPSLTTSKPLSLS